MTDDRPLTVLDTFAGIGGFSLGLERTGGFKTVQFIEIDPFCQKVLAKHWPDVPCHGDIQTYEFREGEADVVTGGFPCQDISVAGKGAGLAGERSGLWRELVRALCVVRPRYAIFENVAALLSRGLGDCLCDLAEIGYDAEWHCIPASAVGAPHRRDRIWIVAHPTEFRCSGARPEPRSAGEAAKEGWLQQFTRGGDVADSFSLRQPQPQGGERNEWRWAGDGGQDMADTYSPLLERQRLSGGIQQERSSLGGSSWWRVEPDVGRVADGVPQRVDRLKALGNSVVPQIPELIGDAILAAEAERQAA